MKGFDQAKYQEALKQTGYPATPVKLATMGVGNFIMAMLILFVMLIYVTMVYGPIAAFLVELFPTKIRYTSMSLPYHLGNGWFGGFLPLIATAVTASTWARGVFGDGAIYAGNLRSSSHKTYGGNFKWVQRLDHPPPNW